MTERWSRDQVLALAPDASSQKAAQGVAAAGKWSLRGTTGRVLYGECKGSGARPYLAAVDLSEPAYRCSCPSRKFPCKHALGLLLLWSSDGVPAQEAAPQWVTEWLDGRAERAAKSAARLDAARARLATDGDPHPASAPSASGRAASTSAPSTSGTAASDSDLAASGMTPPAPGADPSAADPLALAPSASSSSALGSSSSALGSSPSALGSGPAVPGAGLGAPSGVGAASGAVAAQAGGAGGGSGAGDEPARGATGGSRTGAGAGAGAERGGQGGVLAGSGGRVESVRHQRVAAGLAELERWLADQVRQGLAGAQEHDWEGLAKRLIDAQAPGVAGVVSRLARVRAEEGWPGRLLEEYALVNLLAIAYRRRAGLPAPLAQTVLIRTGFPITREEVLAGPPVRDHWDVLGRRDESQDRLTARRVWLRGRHTGRPALILSFAPQGQPLDASLVTGTTIDADLTFYPGAAPLRALVATRHALVPPPTMPPASPPTTPPASPAAAQEPAAQPDAPRPPAAPASPPVAPAHSPPAALAQDAPAASPPSLAAAPTQDPPAALAQDPPAAPPSLAVASAQPPVTAPSPFPAVAPTEPPPAAAQSATRPAMPPPTTPSAAPPATAMPGTAVPGTAVPGAPAGRSGLVPPGMSPDEALDEVAWALAEDPWTESWPLVITGVVPGRTTIGGLPLHPRAHDPWRLIAVSGGQPLTVAVEWTPQGLRPLTAWDDDGTAVIL
ncbi:hypothetical protein HD597_001525 [Nonomuraea thailandensis]|uniref:SWIM-type domain-containing protein n=1 Tax=Nonomuraea thailandensis TaxID=1188745 RepID=A0A9X2K065_9ACTN|nr:hypothetical protein [Nonomuraea thailandensis]